MREMFKAKNSSQYKAIGSILIIAALILVVLFIVTNKKETHFFKEKGDSTIVLLNCVASDPVDPFFVSADANENSHEIKATFKSGELDKISYNYYGSYNSESLADNAHSVLHAHYNNYMGANRLDHEILYPTFEYDGKNVKISLYSSRENTLNQITAKIFLLNSEEYEKIDKYTDEDLKKIYVDKGFVCNIN